MTEIKKLDGEPLVISEGMNQGIPRSLRSALEMNRDVSHGEWGEGPKSISTVGKDKKTYRFYKDSGRGNSEWRMEITDEEGNYVDTVDIVESTDEEYLEKLFEQDIPDSLRKVLEESRDVSYEEFGQKKVVSVKYGEKTYRFYRDDREYAAWAMDVSDERGEYLGTTDIREESDEEYLEKLFEQDIPDSLRRALEESREVSCEEYGQKKVVSVKYGEKTYRFYRDDREYAAWAMDVSDERGEYLGTTDIREKSDEEYLEKLFETPTQERVIQDIRDNM